MLDLKKPAFAVFYEHLVGSYPIPNNLKAKEIIMAASTNDPYMSVEEAIRLQSKLNIGMKIMENAGHINVASGFGKLDCALDWIKREEECELQE